MDVDCKDRDYLVLVYSQLRHLASSYLRKDRPGSTLQPTALVHEAVLRLLQNGEIPAANSAHFLGIAARVMKQILVDRARAKDSAKRVAPLALPMRHGPPPASDGACVLALDEALERLRLLDSRQADIVEMRFFSGMTSEEVAQHLDVSLRTVNREWATARSWLRRELERAEL